MSTVSKHKRLTAVDIIKRKDGEKLVCLTAYDYSSALLCEAAGADLVLVGDSLGNVVQGHDTTIPVTPDQIVYHTSLVSRGLNHALLISDLPFLTFSLGEAETLRNAGRCLVEGGAQAVKLEWQPGGEKVARVLYNAGIPVMGHLGLTPQAIHRLGGFRVQGRGEKQAAAMLDEAKKLEDAGAFAIVLELIPRTLAQRITEAISIPTIGIGAGAHTDGQVLVFHDLLGFPSGVNARHVKQYLNATELLTNALKSFVDETRSGDFPGEEHSFK